MTMDYEDLFPSSDSEMLLSLAERLRRIQIMYGVKGADIDLCRRVAKALEEKDRENRRLHALLKTQAPTVERDYWREPDRGTDEWGNRR